jgi:hypothetical protein
MNTTPSQPLSYPFVSQCIRLRRPASINAPGRGEAGMTGMVQCVIPTSGRELICVRMDQPLQANPLASLQDETWWNCLEWSLGAATLQTFWEDCELLSSFSPVIDQRVRLVREVDRSPSFRALPGMTGTLTEVRLTPGEEFIRAHIDQPLSDDAQQQADIDQEWQNEIHWDTPDFVAAFFHDCLLYPAVGQRIRLQESVENFDLFLAPEGLTGFVIEVSPGPNGDLVRAQMDLPLSHSPGVQAHIEREYQNCINWYELDLPEQTSSALSVFHWDCEYLPSDGLQPVLREHFEGLLADGRMCHIWKGVSWLAALYRKKSEAEIAHEDKSIPDHLRGFSWATVDPFYASPDVVWVAPSRAALIAEGIATQGIDVRALVPEEDQHA